MANVFDYIFNLKGDYTVKINGMSESTAEFQASVNKSQSALESFGQKAIGLEAISNVLRNMNDAKSTFSEGGIKLDSQMHDLSAVAGEVGDDLKKIEGNARERAKAIGTDASVAVEGYKLLLGQMTGEPAKCAEALKTLGERVQITSKMMGNAGVAAAEELRKILFSNINFVVNLKVVPENIERIELIGSDVFNISNNIVNINKSLSVNFVLWRFSLQKKNFANLIGMNVVTNEETRYKKLLVKDQLKVLNKETNFEIINVEKKGNEIKEINEYNIERLLNRKEEQKETYREFLKEEKKFLKISEAISNYRNSLKISGALMNFEMAFNKSLNDAQNLEAKTKIYTKKNGDFYLNRVNQLISSKIEKRTIEHNKLKNKEKQKFMRESIENHLQQEIKERVLYLGKKVKDIEENIKETVVKVLEEELE